jgi:hypothetical protein
MKASNSLQDVLDVRFKDTVLKIRNKYSQKYSHPILLQQNRVDQSWEDINRSQIHECRNWERGRAVSFLGINKSGLLCSVCNFFFVIFGDVKKRSVNKFSCCFLRIYIGGLYTNVTSSSVYKGALSIFLAET